MSSVILASHAMSNHLTVNEFIQLMILTTMITSYLGTQRIQ